MELEFCSPQHVRGMSDETLAITARRCRENISEFQQYEQAIKDEQQRRASANHPTLF